LPSAPGEAVASSAVLEAIRKKLPNALSRPDLEMVALDYFRRLGHDNHRRLSKLYAWEEKKSKTSWGAQTVDYEDEKIAAAAVKPMKGSDLNRFLVVCALVSDLYCPGYNPKESLEKNSNLARTASRYKVDSAKIGAAVRAELSKAKSTPRNETNQRTSQAHRNRHVASRRKNPKPQPERLMFQSWPPGSHAGRWSLDH
jgi:hypothetical protein